MIISLGCNYDEMLHSLQEMTKSLQKKQFIDRDFMKEMFVKKEQLID